MSGIDFSQFKTGDKVRVTIDGTYEWDEGEPCWIRTSKNKAPMMLDIGAAVSIEKLPATSAETAEQWSSGDVLFHDGKAWTVNGTGAQSSRGLAVKWLPLRAFPADTVVLVRYGRPVVDPGMYAELHAVAVDRGTEIDKLTDERDEARASLKLAEGYSDECDAKVRSLQAALCKLQRDYEATVQAATGRMQMTMYRLGRHNKQLIYRQITDQPDNNDPLIAVCNGDIEKAERNAAMIVKVLNTPNPMLMTASEDQHWVDGEQVKWTSTPEVIGGRRKAKASKPKKLKVGSPEPADKSVVIDNAGLAWQRVDSLAPKADGKYRWFLGGTEEAASWRHRSLIEWPVRLIHDGE